MKTTRRLLLVAGILVAVIAGGVVGYMLIEGWSFLDSLYMTAMTITTVGYDEVNPLTVGGRIFSIFLMLGGVGIALYILATGVGYILEGQFGSTLRRQRMKSKIEKLKGHFILCGYGRVGEEIARTFSEEGVPFVIIENRPDNAALAEEYGFLYLLGDATSDKVLLEAGIERARGLVAAVGSDTDNTYIILSARGLHPDLFIAARSCSPANSVKLERAGANRVLSPQALGGRRLALLALRPAVVDFIDTVAYRRGEELQMENIEVSSNSPLLGLTVEDVRHRLGVTVLSKGNKHGALRINPQGEEVIEGGEKLIVIGTRTQLLSLEEGAPVVSP